MPGYAPEKRRKELWDQLSSFAGPLAGGHTLGTFSTLTDAECPMPSYPSLDESRHRLHRAGWSVGETAFGPAHAMVWQVDGRNGETVESLNRGQHALQFRVEPDGRGVRWIMPQEARTHLPAFPSISP